MDECGKNNLPQESINLSTDSDRVKAPVVGAGPADFGGDQTHDIHDSVRRYRSQIGNSEAEIVAALESARKVVSAMKAAMSKQRNVSMDIKTGVHELEEALDVLRTERESQRKTRDDLIDLLWSYAQAAEPARSESETLKNKRTASSRAENQAATPVNKKRREERATPTQWVTVVRKRKGKKAKAPTAPAPNNTTAEEKKETAKSMKKKPETNKQKKPEKRKRLQAVLIQPAEGKTYADILGDIRAKIKPEDTETDVRVIRTTRAGDVLLELGKQSKNAKAFGESLRDALGETGTVRNLSPRVTSELLDLDSITTIKDVEDALEENMGNVKISVTKPNQWGQALSIVELEEEAEMKLLKTARLRVGWVHSRVRRRTQVVRCYKCLGYGHQATGCTGPDRSNLCFKCGKGQHKAAVCKEEPKCVLCCDMQVELESTKHVPGTGVCKAFRQALEKAKGKKA